MEDASDGVELDQIKPERTRCCQFTNPASCRDQDDDYARLMTAYDHAGGRHGGGAAAAVHRWAAPKRHLAGPLHSGHPQAGFHDTGVLEDEGRYCRRVPDRPAQRPRSFRARSGLPPDRIVAARQPGEPRAPARGMGPVLEGECGGAGREVPTEPHPHALPAGAVSGERVPDGDAPSGRGGLRHAEVVAHVVDNAHPPLGCGARDHAGGQRPRLPRARHPVRRSSALRTKRWIRSGAAGTAFAAGRRKLAG